MNFETLWKNPELPLGVPTRGRGGQVGTRALTIWKRIVMVYIHSNKMRPKISKSRMVKTGKTQLNTQKKGRPAVCLESAVVYRLVKIITTKLIIPGSPLQRDEMFGWVAVVECSGEAWHSCSREVFPPKLFDLGDQKPGISVHFWWVKWFVHHRCAVIKTLKALWVWLILQRSKAKGVEREVVETELVWGQNHEAWSNQLWSGRRIAVRCKINKEATCRGSAFCPQQ